MLEKQASAPRLSPFCWVHDTASVLIFKLKVIEKAGGQSNHARRGRHKFNPSLDWVSLDCIPACPSTQIPVMVSGLPHNHFLLLFVTMSSQFWGQRWRIRKQMNKEEPLQLSKRGRGHEEKPGFWGIILQLFVWFYLKLSASEIQNLVSESVRHKGLYLGARDAVFMISETQGTKSQSGQAGEQRGLTACDRSSTGKQAAVAAQLTSIHRNCYWKNLLNPRIWKKIRDFLKRLIRILWGLGKIPHKA